MFARRSWMKFTSALSVGFLSALVSCGKVEHSSDVQFDSATSVALDANVTDAVMITSKPQQRVEEQIKTQLYYTVGYLNGLGGIGDLANRVVTIKSIEPMPGSTTLSVVTYDASFVIAWPRNYQIPSSLRMPVPSRGDGEGLQAFYARYQEDCVQDRHELGLFNFWYYFRPTMGGCPLAGRTGQEPDAYILTANTSLSAVNTSGKSPEYGKVWEDGRLVVTAVFSKYQSGGNENDIGVYAYNQMYDMLLNTFGSPDEVNVRLRRGESPGTRNPDMRMVFRTNRGDVDANILLTDSLTEVNAAWLEHFSERTLVSDFISYGGHSGLGANINALSRMGKFAPGQYQIYYINGCDTFNYTGSAISEAHRLANPESAPSRYVDIITNSMPSPFDGMGWSAHRILEALYNKQRTYRQILSTINTGQNPNVTGEEDNLWPQPFE